MFTHLWSVFLAAVAVAIAITPSMTPHIWMLLGNEFTPSPHYSAT